MTEQLASVPEESATGFTAPCRPHIFYRELIQAVPVSGSPIRWTPPNSQSGYNGSSYSSSGASNSWRSNTSGNSGGTISLLYAFVDNGELTVELTRIAHQMVNDGYIWHMVQAFDDASSAPAASKHGGVRDHALANWFLELDVDWVLQIDDEHGLRRLLRDKSSTMRELVDKWVRALTVTVASITETEYEFSFHRTPAIALFGRASIAKMLDVVDVIITVLQIHEKLRAVLDMFTCVCGTSHMIRPVMVSLEAQSIFKEIGDSLEREGSRLSEMVTSTAKEVRTLVEEDDSWAIEISRGGGEVHKNTWFIMDCIVSMMNARNSTRYSASTHNSENLGGLINGTIDYLNGLLFTKSESCSDQSLRYLFLLNNSYFVAHVVSESSGSFIPGQGHLRLPSECKKYMDSYLDVSWGHVLSCIPKSRFPGPIHCWINTSSLAKFESAFHKMYQAQKLWKVLDPQLRDALRRAIIERVISGYRHYLEEHPELEKHVCRESSSPEVLQEKLEELFEGEN